MTVSAKKPAQKKYARLRFFLLTMACLAAAVALALYALKDNVSLFHSPTAAQALFAAKDPAVAGARVFRLGGMVREGSVARGEKGQALRFAVTDYNTDIDVTFHGIPPDLFRAGQGVVARGHFDDAGVFVAHEILAKHDENYMPAEVRQALEQSRKAGEGSAAP